MLRPINNSLLSIPQELAFKKVYHDIRLVPRSHCEKPVLTYENTKAQISLCIYTVKLASLEKSEFSIFWIVIVADQAGSFELKDGLFLT